MSERLTAAAHTSYFVNVAGVAICEQCTNVAGRGVLWDEAHPAQRTDCRWCGERATNCPNTDGECCCLPCFEHIGHAVAPTALSTTAHPGGDTTDAKEAQHG